jgi:hypothetical protein
MLDRWLRSRSPKKPDEAIHPKANVRSAMNADGGILLDIERGRMLSSNPVGARIWQMIEDGKTRAEIVAAIGADYGVAVDVVNKDFDDFVNALRSQHLVK